MGKKEVNREDQPFWQAKHLAELSADEWEALCDGCARCCLIKFQDEETREIFTTRVACKLLDLHRCRCTAYAERSRLVPACLSLTPDLIQQLNWMPKTCAYRLLSEGKPLRRWHPLISGNPESVHNANISIKYFAISENLVEPDQLEDYIDADESPST